MVQRMLGALLAVAVLLCISKSSLDFVAPQLTHQARNVGLWSSASTLVQGFQTSADSSAGASQPSWAVAAAFLTALAARKLSKVGRAAEGKKKPLRDLVPPPEADAVREERLKGSKRVKGGAKGQRFFSVRNRKFWDFTVWPRTYFRRVWEKKDFSYALLFGLIHIGACFAPFYFNWSAFAVGFFGYVLTGMFGITLSYHRQLAHLSFKSPKIVEYILAYCGALAMQSHPINWVSSHRHHHGATDSPNDVHSPKDGFWWAHAGWLLDQKGTWMRVDRSNAEDLSKQWYYRFLQKTYPIHAIVLPIVGLYLWGGLPFVLWGFFARVVFTWHVTWAVNSVSHVWGFQDWNTGDISMNNWLVGILAFGEGWHNNHHAFENSCRHGLKWWQIDMTWYTIKVLEFFGLARDLKYPTDAKMRKLSWDTSDSGAAAIA
ncbi:unnamed protein product [Effrenium voratum]|uniref:Fatty acid desaturase domain-containing protein n=1 Tax=Effrenium voratum TaxID=2562239 RepID=A0AA36JF28_9DINO|nr:unnamed protein product [Effrenium voratum]CAJ1418792.1 unnamed protein product [Effrenium voratum]